MMAPKSHPIYLSEDGHYGVLEIFEDIDPQLATDTAQELALFNRTNNVDRFLVNVREAAFLGTHSNHYELITLELAQVPVARQWKLFVWRADDDDSHDFLETVAKNSGFQIKVTQDKAEGMAWLLS